MSGKVVSKGTNKAGTVFALVSYTNGTYGVWKLCTNNDSNCAGGVRKTWRYVQKGMNLDDATKLFTRRLRGTQK